MLRNGPRTYLQFCQGVLVVESAVDFFIRQDFVHVRTFILRVRLLTACKQRRQTLIIAKVRFSRDVLVGFLIDRVCETRLQIRVLLFGRCERV